MSPQLPCRWEDRPQVWDQVFERLAWFDRHAERLGLVGAPGVDAARAAVRDIVFETATP